MNSRLSIIASKAIPALSGSALTYNAEHNAFLTALYTSAAGNDYYKVIRVSNRLAVVYHIGQGFFHTFLNGITLVAWNERNGEVIAQKSWGGNNWICFSESFAKEESIRMLKNYLQGQVKGVGHDINEMELLEFSRSLIEETQQKQLTA